MAIEAPSLDFDDPLFLAEMYWPDTEFYDKEEEVIYSIRDADETFVPAGNMLGKDYVGGYIATTFMLAPQVYFPAEYVRDIEAQRSPTNPNPHTVRVITTSVKDEHLKVLWGEINRFVESAVHPLDARKGGPLLVNHRFIRKLVNKTLCPISYLWGLVSERGEGMAGHHAAYTLCIMDEASGIEDLAYTQSDTWAKRKLIIGNPNPCDNFFKKYVELGDLVAK